MKQSANPRKALRKVDLPLIFTHYGFSDYLPYTLACAARTNPLAERILLGDEANRAVARKHGWTHHPAVAFASPKSEKFQRVFRHVRGRDHGVITNGQDWLRYVFVRWFYLEEFLRQQGIDRFWHFDSDTMVLVDLSRYVGRINFDFTTQCNGTCLNGLVRTEVVPEFNDHTIGLFQNQKYLQAQEQHVARHPSHSFNEMTSFDHYQKSSPRRGVHLMEWSKGEVFDDCLRQEHGFEMHTLPTNDGKGCRVKMVWKDKNGFYGSRYGKKVCFLSLNLSWCSKALYQWVLASLCSPKGDLRQIRRSKINHAMRQVRGFLRQVWAGLWPLRKK